MACCHRRAEQGDRERPPRCGPLIAARPWLPPPHPPRRRTGRAGRGCEVWRRVKSAVPLGGLRVTPAALGPTPGSRQRCVWLQRGRATCPDADSLGLLTSEEGELRGIPRDSRPHPVPASSCLQSWAPGHSGKESQDPHPPGTYLLMGRSK